MCRKVQLLKTWCQRGGKSILMTFPFSLHTNTHTLTFVTSCSPFAQSFPQTFVSTQMWLIVCVAVTCELKPNSNVCCCLTTLFLLIKSTEKDDDYFVLCHHWNRWVLLSVQLFLVKSFTQVKHLHWPLTLWLVSVHTTCLLKKFFCLYVSFSRKEGSKKKTISWGASLLLPWPFIQSV